MTLDIPSKLKSADIGRFVTRGAQSEKAKPVIAYWCYFWVVNQIIAKGLHTVDAESNAFTAGLMDKLDQIKAEDSSDAVKDDMVAQAYVEQFGLEVLQRADNTVRAGKASRQTADTYLAAATFLELLQIWGALDQAVTSKIKYAKYHALRIAKAVKAGEDPNASNPKLEPLPAQQSGGDIESPDVIPVEDVNPAGSARTWSMAKEASKEGSLAPGDTAGPDIAARPTPLGDRQKDGDGFSSQPSEWRRHTADESRINLSSGASYQPSVSDRAMSEATKHARWAISALNFEDVNTAVKELREALKLLEMEQ